MDLLDSIHAEIAAGLPNERDRLRDAHDNRRFADGCFEEYPTRPENTPHQRLDYRRTSMIMQRVIDVLTGHLYKTSPTRQIDGNPKATEWLERVYRRNAMLPLWQEADRLSHVGDFAAFQFAGDTDPESPVKVHLWGADQLAVWLDPEDQRKPLAVGSLDRFDGQRRLTLWTAEEKSTWMTNKVTGTQTADGTAYKLRQSVVNPYRTLNGDGVIPFAFVHYKFPSTDFYGRGPGNSLRRINDYCNFDLDDMGDGKRYLSKPIGIAEGTDEGWSPPSMIRPGMFINLSTNSLDQMGNAVKPSLNYLTADASWLGANWDDLNKYIDHSLEMHGVPPGTIRLSASASSGIQIVAEQLPLLTLAEKRRTPFSFYESEAARIAILVGAAHRRNNEATDMTLEAASSDFSLSLAWPNLYTPLPGPDRNNDFEWQLEHGLTDKVEILMQRESITEDQAFERLAKIAERNKKLEAMGLDPSAPSIAKAKAMAAALPSPTPAETA